MSDTIDLPTDQVSIRIVPNVHGDGQETSMMVNVLYEEGPLVLHETPKLNGYLVMKRARYTITHRSTGLCIRPCLQNKKKSIALLIALAQGIDWTGVTVKGLSVENSRKAYQIMKTVYPEALLY